MIPHISFSEILGYGAALYGAGVVSGMLLAAYLSHKFRKVTKRP